MNAAFSQPPGCKARMHSHSGASGRLGTISEAWAAPKGTHKLHLQVPISLVPCVHATSSPPATEIRWCSHVLPKEWQTYCPCYTWL